MITRVKGFIRNFGITDVSPVYYIDEQGKDKKFSWYTKWREMIRRCYDEEYQKTHPTYVGCTVCEEWKYLSNFKQWYESHIQGNDCNYQLDKDLLIPGNKVYSPDACVLVPSEVNALIIKADAIRGQYPIGVAFDKCNKRFKSYCRIYNSTTRKSFKKTIGYFTDPVSASESYIQYKTQVIENYISTVESYSLSTSMKNRIRKALKNQIQLLQEGSYC